jgi:hypothetical protein
MIYAPPGINDIPKGFSGFHFFPLTPTNSPLSLDPPQLVNKAKSDANEMNFVLQLAMGHDLKQLRRSGLLLDVHHLDGSLHGQNGLPLA